MLLFLPPFLVGLVAAVAAEIALGLLLYTGPGFLRALTVVLATLMLALSLGLWTGPVPTTGGGRVEGMRRRWLLALLSLLGAAFTAGAWNVLGGLAGGPLSRGVGLAFLAGLPLYATGAVLAGLASGSPGRPARVGAAATLGAAVGILVTGVFMLPVLDPPNVYVACLVVVSGGALVHGRVLDLDRDRRVVDEEMSPWGRVRVEEVRSSRPVRVERRVLVEEVPRGGVDQDRLPLRRWEMAALDLLIEREPLDPRAPVLLIGAGSVALLERLLADGRNVEVVEPNPSVWRMVLRHFDVPRSAPGLRLREEAPGEALREARGPYAAVVVDGDAFAPGDPFPFPVAGMLASALAAVAPGGRVVLGGRKGEPLLSGEGRALLASLARTGGASSVALYGAPEEALVVLSREGAPDAASLGPLERRPLDLPDGHLQG